MSVTAIVRRVRTLRMLARTAITSESAAIYWARCELAIRYSMRRSRPAKLAA